jgi:hypothetical protein
MFHRNFKRLARPKQREDRDGATSLHHLPMADTETVGNHIFLAEFTRGSAGPDFVTELTKKPGVTGRARMELDSPGANFNI